MIKTRIDPNYKGPTIIEIKDLLDLSEDAIKVRWMNSQQEIDLLKRHPDRDANLVVADALTMIQTASALGIALGLPNEILKESMTALNGDAGEWRSYVTAAGPEVAFSAILANANNRIRNGKSVDRTLRKVLVDCIFEHVSPADMDVLLALRLNGADVDG